MSTVNIDRWVDLDSPEAKKMDRYNLVRKIINVGLETGQITVDKAGYMWMKDLKDTPCHGELDGKLIGLRFAAKASN